MPARRFSVLLVWRGCCLYSLINSSDPLWRTIAILQAILKVPFLTLQSIFMLLLCSIMPLRFGILLYSNYASIVHQGVIMNRGLYITGRETPWCYVNVHANVPEDCSVLINSRQCDGHYESESESWKVNGRSRLPYTKSVRRTWRPIIDLLLYTEKNCRIVPPSKLPHLRKHLLRRWKCMATCMPVEAKLRGDRVKLVSQLYLP